MKGEKMHDNYILVQGWMIENLHLSGNNLLVYALIYGFSQDKTSYFQGTFNYISQLLHISKRTTVYVLNELNNLGLVEKKQDIINGVTVNFYKAVIPQKEPVSQSSEHQSTEQDSLFIEPEKENNEDRTLEIQFNTFWNAFPSTRKAGKTKPKQKFIQIIKSKKATAEQLIKAAEDYAKTDDVTRGFAKEPYSWLLNERYLCDYSKTRALSESEKRTQEAYKVYAEFLAQGE